MKEVTREDLLKGGFTEKEIVRLDDAIIRGGGETGKYEPTIKGLRQIFIRGLCILLFVILSYIFFLLRYRQYWVGLSVVFAFGFSVFFFLIPFGLSCKAYKFISNRNDK